MKQLILILMITILVVPLYADTATKTVTIDVTGKPVVGVLKDIAAQSGETVLVEKLVGGTVTAKLKGAAAEDAISAVSKSAKLMWRKIYVVQRSVLAKDADALAAQMRTVLALRFPDIIISSAGSGGSFMHVQKEIAANELSKSIPSTAGLVAVYLVTDDEKAAKKEMKDASKKKVADYIQASKDQMKTFLDMSPEERNACLKESMNLMNQLGPEGMQEMLKSVMDLDPQYLSDMGRMQMDAFMNMNPDSRKALLKMQLKQQQDMFKNMSPEQTQAFVKEITDIQKELQAEAGGQPQK